MLRYVHGPFLLMFLSQSGLVRVVIGGRALSVNASGTVLITRDWQLVCSSQRMKTAGSDAGQLPRLSAFVSGLPGSV